MSNKEGIDRGFVAYIMAIITVTIFIILPAVFFCSPKESKPIQVECSWQHLNNAKTFCLCTYFNPNNEKFSVTWVPNSICP